MRCSSSAEHGNRRIGRIVQRLCEIETYKSMSMLGFAGCARCQPQLNALDTQLTGLMSAMTDDHSPRRRDAARLAERSRPSWRRCRRKSSFRFGATGAYEAIVNQRIEALREDRYEGRQSFGEFMMRRYEPAMRTVKSAEARLAAMSSRAMRAADLLRTRVDVERSAQNQKLLESMDKRADLQLRLQRTVEGLSVVAISYYAVSLVGYLLYPAAEALEHEQGHADRDGDAARCVAGVVDDPAAAGLGRVGRARRCLAAPKPPRPPSR